jgi:choline monooxygenase
MGGQHPETLEQVEALISDEAAQGEHLAEARAEVFRMWNELNREDQAVLAKLQRGRRSPCYDGGRLSPHWEGPTLQFAQHVLDAMLET